MIYIITTGGTIGGLDYKPDEKKTNSLVSIGSFLENANVSFEYRIDPVLDKDSRSLDIDDRNLIAEK